MTRVQYQGLAGSHPSPILSAVPGSGTTAAQGEWHCYYLQRSRAGHSFASSASITLASGDGLDVEIPASVIPAAPNNGVYVLEHVIMLSRTDDLNAAAVVATFPGYEEDESTLRPLPLVIRLLNDQDFVLNGVVDRNEDLPIGLVHGARRRVTTYYEDNAIIVSKSGLIFYWNAFSSKWAADPDQTFNVSVPSMILTGGANEDVSSLDLNSVVFPEYTAEEGAIAPEVGFWIVNDTEIAIPKGRRVGLIVSMNGEDISTSPGVVGGVLMRFRGYVDVETGVIDPDAEDGNLMAGISYDTLDTPFPYPGPVRPFVLPKDLEPGQAYYLTVQATMSYSDMTGRRPYDGAVMSITPSLGDQVGIYFAAAGIFGSIILAGDGSRRILPGASLTAIASPGSGVIETSGGGYVFSEVPQDQVYYIEPDNAAQNVYINISGGCAVDKSSQPPATALRAIIGTDNGVGKPIYISEHYLSNYIQAVQIDISLPSAIREDYPDVITGQEATLNAAYVVVYIYGSSSDTVYRFRVPISPGQETFSYQCDSTTDIYAGGGTPEDTINPDADFGPFQIKQADVSVSIPGASTVFPPGVYSVYAALEWETSVTRISHASPPCIVESPLTYAEMQAALAYWAQAVETVADLRSLPSDKVINGQTRRVLSTQASWQYWTAIAGADTGTEETEFAEANGLAGGWVKDQSNRLWTESGQPSNTFGKIGDISFDSGGTGNVYRKQANGAWQLITNIRGPQGMAQLAYFAQAEFFHRSDGTAMEIPIATGGEEAFSINQDVFISDEGNGRHGYYRVTARNSNPSRISVVWTNGPEDNPPPTGTSYPYLTRITPTGGIGQDGRLYALTGADFVQPEVDAAVTVQLATEQTEIFLKPSQLTITNGATLYGTYEVISVIDETSLEVTNISGTGGAFPGTTMPAGMRVIPSGAKGAEGNAGTADAGGSLSLTHSTAPTAESDRTKIYSTVDGRVKFVDAEGNGWELVRSPINRKTIYTANAVVSAQDGLRLEIQSENDVTLTIPLNTNQPVPIDTEFTGILTSPITLTVSPEPGVELKSPDDIRVISKQWQGFMLIKRDVDAWWFSPLGGEISSDSPVEQSVMKWLVSGNGNSGNRAVSAVFNGEYWLSGIYVDNGGQDLGPYVYKSTDDRQTWNQITIVHDPSGYVPPGQGERGLSSLLWLSAISKWVILSVAENVYYLMRSPDGETWIADDPSTYPTEYFSGYGWTSNGSVIIFGVGDNQGLTADYTDFIDGTQASTGPDLQGEIDGNVFGDATVAAGLANPGLKREIGWRDGAIAAIAKATVDAEDLLKGEHWAYDYPNAYTGAARTKFDDADSDWFWKFPYWDGYLTGYDDQYSSTYEEVYWKKVYEQLLGFFPNTFNTTEYAIPNRLSYGTHAYINSTDAGLTWSPLFLTPFPGGDTPSDLKASQNRWIGISTDVPITNYGDNGSPDYVGSVFMSDDGVTWISKSFDIQKFPNQDSETDYIQDSVDWWDDTIIVVLHSGKIARSPDSGDSWVLISGLPFENEDFGVGQGYHIYGGGDKRWLVCRGNNGTAGDLWISRDDGLTWNPANQGDEVDVYGVRDQFVNGSGFAYGQPANEIENFSLVSLFRDGEGGAATPLPPGNSGFADATVVSVPYSSNFATLYSTGEPGEPSHAGAGASGSASKSVWYNFTPGSDGKYSFTLYADYCTAIAIYTGSSIGVLTEVASNDESSSGESGVTATLTAGTLYRVAVDGCNGEAGAGVFEVVEVLDIENDDFENATEITTDSYSITTSSALATGQTNEPYHGGSGDGGRSSLWWKYTPPANGFLSASTENSDFDTVAGLYSGVSVNNLSEIGSGDDEVGSQAVITSRPVSSGITYYIAVDGANGETGTIELAVDFVPAPVPANNLYANATAIPDGAFTEDTQNVGASGEVGEPRHANRGGGGIFSRSLWWTITPTADGLLDLNTNGSSYDTLLAVYTGSSVDNLTEIDSDDSGGVGTASEITNILLTAGTTYFVAVDGDYGAVGSLTFSSTFTPGSPPANDNFANAEVITGSSYSVFGGNNIFTTGEVGEPAHAGQALGGANSKSRWWKYVPAVDGSMILSADGTSSGFTPVLSIHAGSSVDSLTELAGDAGFVFFAMTAGSEYYIALDGVGGSTGFFNLTMNYF